MTLLDMLAIALFVVTGTIACIGVTILADYLL